MNLKVISLGGSIVAPVGVDTAFLIELYKALREWLDESQANRLILVIGGGGPAREYQHAYRETRKSDGRDLRDESQDWIGIMATRLNGELLRRVFEDICAEELITDPAEVSLFSGRVLVAAGWKPGFSTDYDAVLLAERFKADTVINLSNIAKVYTADPKLDPKATAIDSIDWKEFKDIVGDEWVPGKNLPFDPVASKHAARLGLKVIVASGKDIPNLKAILRDKPFVGTTIG